MKSAHRHELETNALAHRLEVYIMRYKPYASRIAGVLIAVIILILIWSYISGSSAAKRSEAWDSYNMAVAAMPPNLEEIHRAGQDHPGTPMQQMADVTWADAQVYIASRNYLSNRQAAMESLDRAVSAYQGVIQSSNDEQLTSRARLGLARIYEMQNHLDKAREEYRLVTGAYADYAKQQAERLERPESQDTYAWLATAQPPRPKMPVGPGSPGQRPEFSPGEIALPGAAGADAGKAGDAKGAAEAFDDLLKSMRHETKPGETDDRYQPGQPPAKESNTEPPGETSTAPGSNGAAAPPPAGDAKKPDESLPKTDSPAK